MSDLVRVEFSLAPRTMGEAIEWAKMVSNSDLVPQCYRNKPGNCLVAMQMGHELGLAPLQAIQNIAVINGRPSLWGDALKAIVIASSVCEWIKEAFDEPSITAVCSTKRVGQQPASYQFSKADAVQAGLWNKEGSWRNYPKRMLQLRARGFLLRDIYPDVLKGIAVADDLPDAPEAMAVSETIAKIVNATETSCEATADVASVVAQIEAATTSIELSAALGRIMELPAEQQNELREPYRARMVALRKGEVTATQFRKPAEPQAEPDWNAVERMAQADRS